MDTVPNSAQLPTCLGAPAGLQANCGQPGPHGPHPLGQLLPLPLPTPPAAVDPDWCTVDHAADDERDDLVLHQGDDHTDGTVRRLLGVGSGSVLDIRVSRTDCPSEGRTGLPTLTIRADLELTTWEQAAELARAILDGFGYLPGADR
jgi:hypothetical protein